MKNEINVHDSKDKMEQADCYITPVILLTSVYINQTHILQLFLKSSLWLQIVLNTASKFFD